MSDGSGMLTGTQLSEAARRLGLTQKDIARSTGLSVRTVNRLFNSHRPMAARSSSLRAITAQLGFDAPDVEGSDPPVAIELPLDCLGPERPGLDGLRALLDAAGRTRRQADLLQQVPDVHRERISIVAMRDDILVYERIGRGIRWSGLRLEGRRTHALPDRAVTCAAADRYWKALITGLPVLQFVRTPLGLEFTALSVATDGPAGPSLVTMSAIGAPIPSSYHKT